MASFKVSTLESFLSPEARGMRSLSPSKASLIVLILFLSLWLAACLWWTLFVGHLGFLGMPWGGDVDPVLPVPQGNIRFSWSE